MPLNTNIAMSGQPVQIANPMEMYGKMASIQNAQNQNTLAQYQLGAAQRAEAKDISRTNALAQAGTDDTAIANALLRSGDIKGYSDFLKSRADQGSANIKLLSDKLSLLPEAYKRADTPEAYLTLHQSVHADPILGPWLKSTGATPEKGLATLQNAVETGKFNELSMGSMQSVAQLLEGMKPMSVAASSSVYNPQTGTFNQAPAAPVAPAAPPSMVAEYNFAKTKDGGGFRGDYQQFVTARAAAGRAPAAPRPESAPVAVIDPATGKQIYVTREEALRNRMTPASAGDAKPLNESQSNATAFGLRMKEADSILEDFAKKGVLKGAVIERTPLIGGVLGQTLPSVLGGTSADQQQVNQAKSNFITAVLRKESGAVISDSEFDREDKKYFPQINDNDQVIKQKAKARKLAIQAIEVQAGPGAKNIREYDPRAGAAGSANDPLGLLGGK